MLVSGSFVSAIYAAIPGSKLDHIQGGHVYPTAGATVPEVEFAVGDLTYPWGRASLAHLCERWNDGAHIAFALAKARFVK